MYTAPPDDSAFDAFLEEINQGNNVAGERVDTQDFDRRFQQTLDATEYIPLGDDIERAEALYIARLDQETATQSSEVHSIANQARAFAAVNEAHDNELLALEAVRATARSAEQSLLSGSLSQDEIAEIKAKLFVRLGIEYNFPYDHPMYAVLNHAVAGPVYSVDDEALIPYYLEAMEEATNSKEREAKAIEDMYEMCRYLHVDPADESPENQERIFALVSIVQLSRTYIGDTAKNVSAEREERVRDEARRSGVELELTERLVEYIDWKYPLDQQPV